MKFPWSHSTLVEVLKNDSKLHHKCDKVCEGNVQGFGFGFGLWLFFYHN